MPPIAADELRGLVMESLSDDKLTIRVYFDGISESALEN